MKKREPRRETVAVQHVVDGIRALVELQARQSCVGLQIHCPPGLPPVLADRLLIEQVLLNLTRNAIEAMQGDRAGAAGAAHQRGAKSTTRVAVSVIDQGHGIAPEVAERLFSPFFSTKAEGMGMGLSICRTAIEFHGGVLTHADNPGGGTIFTFSLQRAQPTARAGRLE